MSANPSWDCLVVGLERDCIEASLAEIGIVVLANFDRLQASVHLEIHQLLMQQPAKKSENMMKVLENNLPAQCCSSNRTCQLLTFQPTLKSS